MLILGLDPGSSVVGFGLLAANTQRAVHYVTSGIINLGTHTTPLAQRLAILHTDIAEIIQKYQPNLIGLETIFAGHNNPKSTITLAQARGVIVANIGLSKLPLIEVHPRKVKEFLTGHGAAQKSFMRESLEKQLSIPPKLKPDAIDALAIAWASYHLSHSLIVHKP